MQFVKCRLNINVASAFSLVLDYDGFVCEWLYLDCCLCCLRTLSSGWCCLHARVLLLVWCASFSAQFWTYELGTFISSDCRVDSRSVTIGDCRVKLRC